MIPPIVNTLHHADYAERLDLEVWDALITDPPFSARTHTGEGRARSKDKSKRRKLPYAPWSAGDASTFAAWAHERTRGWIVIITDHVLWPSYAETLATVCDRYVFAPIPYVEPGSRVRLSGDGPSSWTCWIVVARPKRAPFSKWGTLPGAYIGSADRDRHQGGKSLALMHAIVSDYSRPGDLICDPCAGYATTLDAARRAGRRFVGCERDADTFNAAAEILRRPYTPPLIGRRMDFSENPKLQVIA